MSGLILSALVLTVLMASWRTAQRRHETRIRQIPLRIHVNGIRGKSTVTRLIAGVLREAGFRTIAKTTGSAACIIHEDGNESSIKRRGAPTILEQIDIVRQYTKPDTEALVIECMAVNPLYQKVSQEQIVKGNITIITNVREDHQDVMGQTLPEIADALSSTMPRGGLVISAEGRPELRERLEANARARGSAFLFADGASVADEELQGFGYLSFKENVAIGFAIAAMLGIPRDVALRGMQRSIPDIGVTTVQRAQLQQKTVVWAPLFAVNDRESTIMNVEALRQYVKPGATRIGILNNRYDRAMRALQFAEIAARDLKLDYYITFGAYEEQVTRRMIELGYPRDCIINLGFGQNPGLEEILTAISDLINDDEALLIGMVNIHTPQAELLLEHFAHQRGDHLKQHTLVSDLGHIAVHAQRRRYQLSRALQVTGVQS